MLAYVNPLVSFLTVGRQLFLILSGTNERCWLSVDDVERRVVGRLQWESGVLWNVSKVTQQLRETRLTLHRSNQHSVTFLPILKRNSLLCLEIFFIKKSCNSVTYLRGGGFPGSNPPRTNRNCFLLHITTLNKYLNNKFRFLIWSITAKTPLFIKTEICH